MLSRYILPALAVANGAYAQCTISSTTTFTANTDATAIAGCATFSGSVALATSVSGAVDFDGIEKFYGSIVGTDIANITSISASTLTTLSGSLNLTTGTNLNNLNFPELTEAGTIAFVALGPQYQSTGFGALASVTNLIITDTYLQTLDGINLTSSADTVTIAQNTYLSAISIAVTSVTGTLSVSANDDGQATADFPDLTTAGAIDIHNVSSLSLPALDNVTGLFYLDGNNFDILHLPNFTTSQGFTLNNNNDMTNFTVPKYKTSTGSVNIENNTALTGTISFPVLATVDGSAYFIGDFTGLNLPDLNTIQGVMVIDSSKTISSVCSEYTPLSGNEVHGSVTCDTGGSSSSSTASGSSSSSTSSGSSSSSSSSAASVQYGPSTASSFTVFGMLAALFGLLM